MRTAGIYARTGKVFVYSVHGMISGNLKLDDTIVLEQADLVGIGTAVRSKLSTYRDDVPVPRWDLMKGDQFPNLHAAAGVRSSREFMKGAKSVSVRWDQGRITLTPWENDGSGFAPLKECDQIISDMSSDADLGAAVIAALEDAE